MRSDRSPASPMVFGGHAGGVPGTPIINDVLPGPESIQVFFSPPLVNGGRQITGYKCKVEPGGKEISCGESSPLIIEGLKNGVVYRVAMACSNNMGQGAWTQKSKPCAPGE